MRSFARLLIVVALFGCQPSDDERSGELSDLGSREEAAKTHDAALSWGEQIDAVRNGNSDSVRVSRDETISSKEFRELQRGCESLTSLWIERAELRDDDLELLRELPELSLLRLPTEVDDRGLALLSECRALKNLNLPNGRFTDDGFAAVRKLQQLESLRIGSPSLTDEGLVAIAELPRLRFLHLIDVPITDAGLDHVAAKATLESFYLDGGNCSDSGLRELLRKRRDLHFHKDQKHLASDPNSHDHD